MITKRWTKFSLSNVRSIDGGAFIRPVLGDMESAYNRFFAFARGGLFVGNPLNGEDISFVRLFDFYNFYAPIRVNALPIGGGILVAYNAHHDAVYQPKTEEEKLNATFTNMISGPSVLVYIVPPMVKIVGTFGARITSIEKVNGKLLIAANTTPNTGALVATPFDTGQRDIIVLDEKILQENPPATSFSFSLEYPSVTKQPFGGVPLEGYKNPRLILHLSKDNRLEIFEYDIKLPIDEAYSESFDVKKGRNVIDLSSFTGIVSFKIEEQDLKGKARIELR